MSIGSRLKHFFFGVPLAERFCHNCDYCGGEETLQNALKGEHPVLIHHVTQSGNWNPRGKDNSPLGYCSKRNFAVALTAISCEEWKEKGR